MDDDFEVFEENWEAVKTFLRLQTQWRFSDGVFLGLDYSAVEVVLKIGRSKDKKALFDDLQIMEVAALRILNKRK